MANQIVCPKCFSDLTKKESATREVWDTESTEDNFLTLLGHFEIEGDWKDDESFEESVKIHGGEGLEYDEDDSYAFFCRECSEVVDGEITPLPNAINFIKE